MKIMKIKDGGLFFYFITAAAVLYQGTVSAGTIPDDGTLCEKGKALFEDGAYSKAEKVLENAVALNPENAEAYYFLGYVKDRLARRKDGIWYGREKTEAISRSFEKVIALTKGTRYTGGIYLLNPQDKIFSLWASLAQRVLSAGDEAAARKAFDEAKKRGGFDEVVYRYMRTTLQTCPEDALLFTGGDMDTFYPLYLQLVEGFRTDVAVLNIHLLKELWFVQSLSKPDRWRKRPLAVPFSAEELIELYHGAATTELPVSVQIPQLGCRESDDHGTAVRIVESNDADEKKLHRMHPRDVTLLKIIEANPQRPLCIAATMARIPFGYRLEHNGSVWNPHDDRERCGPAFQFTFCKSDIAALAEKNSALIRETLHHSPLPDSPLINDYQYIAQQYLQWCIETAVMLNRVGRQDEARRLITEFVTQAGGIRYLTDTTQRECLLKMAGTGN